MAGFSPNESYGSESYADYVLLTDAKTFLQIDQDDTSRDWALQVAVSAACTKIQRFCNRPIGETLYEPPFGVFNGGSGNTSSYIVLPRQPVLQVVSVIEYQGATPVALSEIDPNSSSSNYETGDGYRVDYRSGTIERIMGGVWQRPWMPSEMGVWVTWIAGMRPVPSDLYFSTITWAAELFRVTQQRMSGTGPLRGAGGNSNDNGPWPGIPSWLRGQLQDYVYPGIG